MKHESFRQIAVHAYILAVIAMVSAFGLIGFGLYYGVASPVSLAFVLFGTTWLSRKACDSGRDRIAIA